MRLSKLLTALTAIAVAACGAQAADRYPNRPVHIIIPFGSGGSLSVLAMALGEQLGERWGQQPVVDARPGAGGNIGTEAVAHAAPDGYTLLFGTQSLAANATLEPSDKFDPIKSFDPIVMIGLGQSILVVPPNSPFKTLKELVDYAKAHPGELNAASVGIGSTSFLAAEQFKNTAGIDALLVPYNGAAPAVTDLIAGRISFWITTLASVLPNITSGQMRALAISGDHRATELPDVPTFAEAGYPQFRGNAWFALFAPAGTPKEIVAQLNRDVNEALTAQSVRDRFAALSVTPSGGTSDAMRDFLRDEVQTWSKLLTKGGADQKQ
jgi:tripartite-type tricarboxylate transporter receptor subunit TctC